MGIMRRPNFDLWPTKPKLGQWKPLRVGAHRETNKQTNRLETLEPAGLWWQQQVFLQISVHGSVGRENNVSLINMDFYRRWCRCLRSTQREKCTQQFPRVFLQRSVREIVNFNFVSQPRVDHKSTTSVPHIVCVEADKSRFSCGFSYLHDLDV